MVFCDTQAEIDYYWERLTEGGDPEAQQCGWLKNKFGLVAGGSQRAG
jgi:predicted 3-demethylubiquinone-9 3-methyltransferase (glyoxalase superfamily)